MNPEFLTQNFIYELERSHLRTSLRFGVTTTHVSTSLSRWSSFTWDSPKSHRSYSGYKLGIWKLAFCRLVDCTMGNVWSGIFCAWLILEVYWPHCCSSFDHSFTNLDTKSLKYLLKNYELHFAAHFLSNNSISLSKQCLHDISIKEIHSVHRPWFLHDFQNCLQNFSEAINQFPKLYTATDTHTHTEANKEEQSFNTFSLKIFHLKTIEGGKTWCTRDTSCCSCTARERNEINESEKEIERSPGREDKKL